MYSRCSLITSLLIAIVFACGSKHRVKSFSLNDTIQEIQCSLSSYQKDISAPFIGFNTNTIKGPKWTDKQLQTVLQKFNPQFLRYPGGSVSSIWDWRKGGFSDNLPADAFEEKDFSKREIVTSTLEEFKTAIDVTSATPVFVLNMVTSDFKEQLAMLKHAEEIGLNVEYIEMGNEYYKGQSIFIKKFPTPQDYAKEAVLWAKEIKKEFPNAKFSVIATRKGQDKDDRMASWNQGVFEIIKNEKIIDAISVHAYAGPGHGVKELKNAMTINDMANVLGASFAGELLIDVDAPAGKKIWITEYNVFDVKKDVMNSRWVHGLYIANMTLGFLNNQNVDMVLYHSLIGNPSFRAIFTGKSDLINVGSNTPTQPFDFSAAGFAYSIILNAMKDKDIATRINFTNNISIQSGFSKTYNALVGWSFKGNESSEIILLNLSEKEIRLDVKDLKISENISYVTYNVSNPIEFWPSSDAIIKKNGKVENNKIHLPPYSILILNH